MSLSLAIVWPLEHSLKGAMQLGMNGNQADNSAPNSGAVDFFSLGEL